MSKIGPILLALVFLLVPIFAALPEGTTAAQTVWTSLLSATLLLAAAFLVKQRSGTKIEYALALLLGLAALSMVARLIVQHNASYLGLMLRAIAILTAQIAAFLLARQAAQAERKWLYLIILAAVAASAVVTDIGVQSYVAGLRAHGDPNARIFATSTPDYLAGYLVLLLPVTLALFLGTPSLMSLFYGLVVILQLVTMFFTGSRFALVSLAIALLLFGIALWHTVRQGMVLERTMRLRLIGIGICALLATVVGARGVLHRLEHPEANSAAFRKYTWHGAATMAAKNPILGTGIGTWADLYPRYAITGYTGLAHNSYLQMADECGVPAFLVFLAALSLLSSLLWRGLSLTVPAEADSPLPLPQPKRGKSRILEAPPPSKPISDWVKFVAPKDDRLVLCGLMAGLTAGIVQNLIDSDWYVFFLGLTFWTMAGLGVGIAQKRSAAEFVFTRRLRLVMAAVTGLLGLVSLTQGIAATYAAHAEESADPAELAEALMAAQTWDPLNSRYPRDLGYKIKAPQGDLAGATSQLRHAAALEPSEQNLIRLASLLGRQAQIPEAISVLQKGIRDNPTSLQMRLDLAALLPPEEAVPIYQAITRLEDSPVGTARALAITEVKFATADSVVADSDYAQGRIADAARYYQRAQRLLESYADEGGSNHLMRLASHGYRTDPETDTQMRTLYLHVMDGLTKTQPASQQRQLQSRRGDYQAKFASVIDQAVKQGKL